MADDPIRKVPPKPGTLRALYERERIRAGQRPSGAAPLPTEPSESASPMHAKDRRFWLAILWAGSIGGALAVGCYIAWASGQMPLHLAAPGIAIGLLAMAGATIYAFEKRPPNVWRPGLILLGIAALTWALVGWQTWLWFHPSIQGYTQAQLDKAVADATASPSAFSQHQPAPVPPDQWPALTRTKASALAEHIRSIPPEDIVVACETINCRDLADGIADILLKTEGWKVSVLHRGGLGITGVTGILLNPNEPATQTLKEAIESTTKLKVTIGPDARKDIGSNQSFLTIGTRPF